MGVGGMAMARVCDICGKEIPEERLKALPDTRRCVECATKNGSDVVAKKHNVGMDIETYKDLLGATRN
jgi:hypothetical protein